MARNNFFHQTKLAPWLFLLPAAIFFGVYVIWPIIQSMLLSLYDWDGLGDKEFIGMGNYVELFRDPQFLVSIKNNVLWLIFLMLSPVLGLGLALFLNQQIRGIKLVKSLFFFPFVISLVIVGVIYSWFYDPHQGLMNTLLSSLFGNVRLTILTDENLVTFGIIFAALWPQTAYCMILYLTGLTNVNSEQVEAARIDGAKGFKMLWHIILPQLRPATFIAIVVTVIGALRSFDLVAIMTAGGPYNSSSVLAWFMYEQTIFSYRVGYGAAIATVLFLITLAYIAYFLWNMVRQERS